MAHDQGETPTTAPWFTLSRHDDGDEDQPATDPNPDDDTDDQNDADADQGDEQPKDDAPPKGKPIDWKKRSRDWERRSKENADKAKKFDELEAAKKSNEERLTDGLAAAEARAEKAMTRAVNAEIAALAAEAFADPSDAVDALTAAEYIDGDDIDTDAISDALADLLERKPHWAKAKDAPADPKPPKLRPDPGQGPRGGDTKVNFRNASREETAAELAKYGLRTRSS